MTVALTRLAGDHRQATAVACPGALAGEPDTHRERRVGADATGERDGPYDIVVLKGQPRTVR